MTLGAGRFTPFPGNPRKTHIDYVVCVDPKIYFAPQRLIDSCIAYTIHRDSVYARKNVEKLKEERKCSQEATQMSEGQKD